MLDRNELLAQADELADMIIQSPEITRYQIAENNMRTHKDALQLLARVQELQSQVAEFQARRVPPMHFSHLLEETESLFAKMENIPEVQAFQAAQSAVNELLQSVTKRLADAVLTRVSDTPST